MENQGDISGYVESFLQELKRLKYSPKSLDTYSMALSRFVIFLTAEDTVRVRDITSDHLETYRLRLTEVNLSNATIYVYLRSARFFCNWLEQHHAVFLNPARTFVILKVKRRLQHVPTEADIRRVLSAPNTGTAVGVRDRAILEVFYTCGLRKGELLNLSIFDPDMGTGHLRIMGKGRKERMVPLGRHAVFWLNRYLESARPALSKNADETALWISKTSGLKLSEASIDRLIRDYAGQAGIKGRISAHSLRRACASHMLKNGAHPVQIQMLLGHSSLKCLGQYLKVTITDMQHMHERSKPGK